MWKNRFSPEHTENFLYNLHTVNMRNCPYYRTKQGVQDICKNKSEKFPKKMLQIYARGCIIITSLKKPL